MPSHPDPLAPLRPLGAVLTPDLVQATYRVITPLATALDPAVTRATWDIAYGPHPRNRLDLYRPAGGEPAETLVLFVHGGGFAGGDKGGEIVAMGTPEQVSKEPRSYTGQYLLPYLGQAAAE